MNVELLSKIIKEHIGTIFRYTIFESGELVEKHIKNKDTMIQALCEALGYENTSAFYKVLSGETKCPRKDKMEKLHKMFKVSFYLPKECTNMNETKEPRVMINDIAKMTLLKMYSETIKFFNDEVDCMETIEEHLRELDRFRLGVPTEIFNKYINYLKELVYNLPEIDCSDVLIEGNVIPDEESMEVLIYRHFERTLSAKYSFQEFAEKEFATIIHC